MRRTTFSLAMAYACVVLPANGQSQAVVDGDGQHTKNLTEPSYFGASNSAERKMPTAGY